MLGHWLLNVLIAWQLFHRVSFQLRWIRNCCPYCTRTLVNNGTHRCTHEPVSSGDRESTAWCVCVYVRLHHHQIHARMYAHFHSDDTRAHTHRHAHRTNSTCFPQRTTSARLSILIQYTGAAHTQRHRWLPVSMIVCVRPLFSIVNIEGFVVYLSGGWRKEHGCE